MKKFTLFFAAIIVALGVKGQDPSIDVSTKWQFSVATGDLPTYIGSSNNCRGMAFGVFDGEKVLAVVTREGGSQILLLDPSDGSQKSSLTVSSIVTGGNFAINDAVITDDGKMLVCNTIVGAGTFKVYRWDKVTDEPTVAIQYATATTERLGDTFTATGSIDDGTAKVYASNGAAGTGKILCWSMIQDVDNPGSYIFDQTPVDFSTAMHGISVSVGSNIDFLPDGSFLHKSTRSVISRISSDGTTVLSSIPDLVAPNDAGMSVKYIATGADMTSYITYFAAMPGTQLCRIFAVTDWDLDAVTDPVASTPSFGDGDIDLNRTGKVASEIEDGKVYLYVLGTNSGIGKYEITGIDMGTGIKNPLNNNLNVNLSGGILSVTGIDSPSITLYNTIGQKVKSTVNSNQLPVNELKGIYIVSITKGNAIIKTDKVFIK